MNIKRNPQEVWRGSGKGNTPALNDVMPVQAMESPIRLLSRIWVLLRKDWYRPNTPKSAVMPVSIAPVLKIHGWRENCVPSMLAACCEKLYPG